MGLKEFKKNLKGIYNYKLEARLLRLHVNRYLQYVLVKLIDGSKDSDWWYDSIILTIYI